MAKLSTTDLPRSLAPADIHAEGWEHALEAALSVLRGIDARYEQDRARIEKLGERGQARTRRLLELDLRHRKDREPYVLHLAEIHQRVMDMRLWQPIH
jgi:hypothetical protein